MNKFLLTAFFLMVCITVTKSQQLVFNYDAAGNQVQRKWICINCPIPLAPEKTEEKKLANNANVSALAPSDKLELPGKNRMLKAYPNPVTEILNVNWQITEQNLYVKTIEVYTINGINVWRKEFANGYTSTEISFSRLVPGTYLLRVVYSDQKQEILKIIKH